MILDEIEDKNPKDDLQHTPFHEAAKNGHIEICNIILEKVDDKNPKNCNGDTPLHFFALNGNKEIFSQIFEKVEEKILGTPIN